MGRLLTPYEGFFICIISFNIDLIWFNDSVSDQFSNGESVAGKTRASHYWEKLSYHQATSPNPSGDVTVRISVRQSLIRKTNPANSMLPTAQDRPPNTLTNDLRCMKTHSIPARRGQWPNDWKIIHAYCLMNCDSFIQHPLELIACPISPIWGSVLSTWLNLKSFGRRELLSYQELWRWCWFLTAQPR